MIDREYADWTIQQLRDYEENLYDREIEGEDVWFERDKILWELNYRKLENLK